MADGLLPLEVAAGALPKAADLIDVLVYFSDQHAAERDADGDTNGALIARILSDAGRDDAAAARRLAARFDQFLKLAEEA